jgi:hypothetical protein
MLLLAIISPDWKVFPPKNIGARKIKNRITIVKIAARV